MKTIGWHLSSLAICAVLLAGCSSSPSSPSGSYASDMARLMGMYEEIVPLGGLPESSFLAEGEVPRIKVADAEKMVTSERELEQAVKREASHFYRVVGCLNGSSGSTVTGTFGGDVAALCWELRIGMAVWEITAENSEYISGYTVGTSYVPGYTRKSYTYKAYFLVPIPRSDRDAWMLGMNVKDLSYEDRDRLSRNTGVLVTDVYDGTPAFEANLRPDYVITVVNDHPVSSMEDWRRVSADFAVGVPVSLTTAHYGHNEYFTETLTPRAIPPEEARPAGAVSRLVPGRGSGMVFVEGGTFRMGNDAVSDTRPAHEVTVDGFYMCAHEVTQAEWEAVMGANPSYCVGGRFVTDFQPVERVTWRQAIDYCNKRSASEGLKPCYRNDPNGGGWQCDWNADGYRLPTEAEWEFAARGGNGGRDGLYSGGDSLGDVAWYSDNTGFPQPVMMKFPNRLGIYDMTGNVTEWCWDKYNAAYYEGSPDKNPRGSSSSSESSARSARGASAYSKADQCVLSARWYKNFKEASKDVGLRVVRSRMDASELEQSFPQEQSGGYDGYAEYDGYDDYGAYDDGYGEPDDEPPVRVYSDMSGTSVQ